MSFCLLYTLTWPKNLFSSSHNILQKNPNKLFGQPNISFIYCCSLEKRMHSILHSPSHLKRGVSSISTVFFLKEYMPTCQIIGKRPWGNPYDSKPESPGEKVAKLLSLGDHSPRPCPVPPVARFAWWGSGRGEGGKLGLRATGTHQRPCRILDRGATSGQVQTEGCPGVDACPVRSPNSRRNGPDSNSW